MATPPKDFITFKDQNAANLKIDPGVALFYSHKLTRSNDDFSPNVYERTPWLINHKSLEVNGLVGNEVEEEVEALPAIKIPWTLDERGGYCTGRQFGDQPLLDPIIFAKQYENQPVFTAEETREAIKEIAAARGKKVG